MKYSTLSGALRWSEGTIVLRRGDSIEDDHPLVAERPDVFSDEEPGADIGGKGRSSRVETGMQSPGGMRTERGPRVIKAPPRGTPSNG